MTVVALRWSLRGRLVAAAVAVGIVFAAAFGALATWRVHRIEDSAVHSALVTRLDLARDGVRPDGSLAVDRPSSPKSDLVQVVGPDGQVRASSPSLAGLGALVPLASVHQAGPSGAQVDLALQRPDIDIAALGVPLDLQATSTSPAGMGELVVAVDTEGFVTARRDLVGLLVVGLLTVVVAIAVLSWALAGRALKAVTRLTEEADALRARDLADGLPVPANDAEVARLVTALNRMLARLNAAHARELAFAADAGHRLRTPIATLRAEAELALGDSDDADRVEALRRIVGDADLLNRIVERVLARSRADVAPGEPVMLALRPLTEHWQRQAAHADLSLTVSTRDLDGVAVADLAAVVDPLVDNAVRHTLPGGHVEVDVSRIGPGRVRIGVRNDGEGVDPRLVASMFDAWVSGRPATSAGGLGLWLSRETARESGGDVVLVDPSAGRTLIEALLPVIGTDGSTDGQHP